MPGRSTRLGVSHSPSTDGHGLRMDHRRRHRPCRRRRRCEDSSVRGSGRSCHGIRKESCQELAQCRRTCISGRGMLAQGCRGTNERFLEMTSPALLLSRSECDRKRRSIRSSRESKNVSMTSARDQRERQHQQAMEGCPDERDIPSKTMPSPIPLEPSSCDDPRKDEPRERMPRVGRLAWPSP
jgi:hypothetical protein